MSLLLFLALAAAEAPFEPSSETFADAARCRAHLVGLVAAARREGYAAAQGPYQITSGDVRAHRVRADESGHSITEHRCLEEKLSARTWRHSMGGEAEESATIESMAARAEWLKKGGAQQ